MSLSPRLDLRQTTSLTMTPQLQQAIRLLQLSNLELAAEIQGELETNPLLEQIDSDDFEPVEEILSEEPAALVSEGGGLDVPPGQESETVLDIDYDNAWHGDETAGYEPTQAGEMGIRVQHGLTHNDQDSNFISAKKETLRDFLEAQIGLEFIHLEDRLIALYLTNMLDENGYLHEKIEDTAVRLGYPVHKLFNILERLKTFEPAGVFASSLEECLALQLRERHRFDPAIEAMLAHLDLVAAREWHALEKICGVDRDDVMDMVAEIRSLNPRPGQCFLHEPVQTLIPDILMHSAEDGAWILELNPETLPRLLVNETYFTHVSRTAHKAEEKSYLSSQLQSARWLVRALDQRAITILKVAKAIVEQQEAFFRKGIQFMRPLVLRDIAALVEMHESTISRVTAGKYIAPPRGVYELKYFFTQGLLSANGENVSTETIRFRIKTLVDAESPTAILSDEDLVNLLKEEGFDVARRTVAKYREMLKLGSSVQRRKEKNRK